MEVVNSDNDSNTFQLHVGVKKISPDGESFRVIEKETYEEISFDVLKNFLPDGMYKSIRNTQYASMDAEECRQKEYELRMTFQNGGVFDSSILPNEQDEVCDEIDDVKRKR